MALARRTVTPAPPAEELVDFGAPTFYSGSLGLPEGTYQLTFETFMFTPTKRDGSPSGSAAFLAVKIDPYPITNGEIAAEPIEPHILGMGRKAHLSFAPSADGKGLVRVPGGPAQGLPGMTNWDIWLKSMREAGLPEGYFTGDLKQLDGCCVMTQNVPEPKERKQFQSATGEAAMSGEAEQRRDGVCAVVVEFLEGGKPWEGTVSAPATSAKKAAAPVARISPKAAPKAAAAPAPVDENESLEDAVLKTAADVLGIEANSKGMTKLALRTAIHTQLKKTYSDDHAQAYQQEIAGKDDVFNALLGQLGFTIKGINVVVA